MKPRSSLALCLLATLTTPAFAAPDKPVPPRSGDTSIQALAARIKALEANAEQLRQQAADALAAAHAAQAELAKMQADQQQAQQEAAITAVSNPTPPAQFSGIGTGNAFNPAIAVILNGYYAHHSLDPENLQRAGFPLVGEGEPVPQGLSLGESEVSLAANIDDKFYGQLTVTAESEHGEDHIGVEEAYIDTTALPDGFGVRAGRFYSNIGYLNSHHAHTDFFVDRPLAYQAFLGNQFGDDGVQVQWVAPTDVFLQFGGEAFRGENYPASGAGHGGAGARTLFVHAGGDVGVRNAWFAGISALRANARDGEDGFSGNDTLYVADGTWKWSPHGNFKDGGFMLRGEYLVDKRNGDYAPAPPVDVAGDDPAVAALAQPWVGTRRGGYIEGVYAFNRTWDTGYRYDRLWADDDGPYASDFNPYRHSAMLTWRNSEFSLLRLEVSHEKPDRERSDNAVMLQYQVALGAHGAHKF
jgi:hypothetical protein